MVQNKAAILERLRSGEIFREDTWDSSCVNEASYALRIAGDGLLLNGEVYPPGTENSDAAPYFSIKRGEIAIFSTIERLNMPNDIVGHLGIRYDYAVQGLTKLMGIQVDPAYGRGVTDERLYLRVANLGNQDVKVRPGDAIFNVEFRKLVGDIDDSILVRRPMWERLEKTLLQRPNPSESYIAQARNELKEGMEDVKSQYEHDMEQVRQGLQPVVMFGVFLVAATLLSVAISVILNLREIPEVDVPSWVTNWGWIIIVASLGTSGVFTAAVGALTAWHFLMGNGIIRRSKR